MLDDEVSLDPHSYGNTISNNLFYNADVGAYSWTITPGSRLNDMLFAGNTLVDSALVTGHDTLIGTGNQIMDNLFCGSSNVVAATAGITWSHNLWQYDRPANAVGTGDLVDVDPQLALAGSTLEGQLTHNYFTLASASSPAIGAGTPLASVTTDYFGIARDPSTPTIGAHEYTGAPLITGITPIPTISRHVTPSLTFASDALGTISYTGDCTSATTSAIQGSNTLSLNTLARGAHTNCALTVTHSGMTSVPFSLSPFTVSYQSDLNQDGTVNILDFGLLHNHYGTTDTAGDVNYDGNVNVLDFGVLHTEYGSSVP